MEKLQNVDYRTHPEHYKHWRLHVEGEVATLWADFDENAGLRPGYKLKLNSYDLGVDVELNDAVNRIRFEQPQVKVVVITSAKEKVFCSGANIFMLGVSTHAWKVNFCKFTNETRNGLEDSSMHGGLKFLAAVNGACAGGGYELALACDEIILIDDRSSAVSLPEVPLLGVLPGTGGLTRVTDKRKVRHDLADIFCTTTEGVRGQKAKDWRLVDEIAKPAAFNEAVAKRAKALAATSGRPGLAQAGTGILLSALERTVEENSVSYKHVQVDIDRAKRVATFTVHTPQTDQAKTIHDAHALGHTWYPLALAREIEDAVLHMRTNECETGLWLIKTKGNASQILALDQFLTEHQTHWLVQETTAYLRRTFSRLDLSARSLFAIVDEGSCFTGTLLELALVCDRIYHLARPDEPQTAPVICVTQTNFNLYPMVTGQSRLDRRFYGEHAPLERIRSAINQNLSAQQSLELGLCTSAPDDIDWSDEIRIACEERVAMSPDALTGMEANLRFNGVENMFTRVFGRLSAWQNWIFQRPNAVGDKGALKVYGKGEKVQFDWTRV